jgi:hypothetical protein
MNQMMQKRKLLAPFMMLAAGAVASVIMFIVGYEPERRLGILLGVLLLFYILGGILSYMIGRFHNQNEAAAAALAALEGEVIEKENETDDEAPAIEADPPASDPPTSDPIVVDESIN